MTVQVVNRIDWIRWISVRIFYQIFQFSDHSKISSDNNLIPSKMHCTTPRIHGANSQRRWRIDNEEETQKSKAEQRRREKIFFKKKYKLRQVQFSRCGSIFFIVFVLILLKLRLSKSTKNDRTVCAHWRKESHRKTVKKLNNFQRNNFFYLSGILSTFKRYLPENEMHLSAFGAKERVIFRIFKFFSTWRSIDDDCRRWLARLRLLLDSRIHNFLRNFQMKWKIQ